LTRALDQIFITRGASETSGARVFIQNAKKTNKKTQIARKLYLGKDVAFFIVQY